VDRGVRAVMIAFAFTIGGIVELSQPKEKECRQMTPIFTEDEFTYLLLSELGNITFCHSGSDEEIPQKHIEEARLHPWIMTKIATWKSYIAFGMLFEEPEESIGDTIVTTYDSTKYVVKYQQSEVELGEQNLTEPDCNDNAYSTCQRLDRLGIPMYLISIWPRNPEERFDTDKDWHQMAACRIGENRFLIIDNSKIVTIWEGSLESFVTKCKTGSSKYAYEIPMSIIPRLGISRFAEPKHNNGPSKMMTQSLQSVGSEDRMEIVQILDDSIQLAQK